MSSEKIAATRRAISSAVPGRRLLHPSSLLIRRRTWAYVFRQDRREAQSRLLCFESGGGRDYALSRCRVGIEGHTCPRCRSGLCCDRSESRRARARSRTRIYRQAHPRPPAGNSGGDCTPGRCDLLRRHSVPDGRDDLCRRRARDSTLKDTGDRREEIEEPEVIARLFSCPSRPYVTSRAP